MDTVTNVGLPSSVLGPTHQSSPASSTPDVGGPKSASVHNTAQQKTGAPQTGPGQDPGDAVDEFLKNLRIATTRLRIDHDKTGVFVYQSIDPMSGEVKGQYPSEERLRELAFFAELDSKKNGGTTA